MEASAVAYSTLLESMVKTVFAHIDQTCEMAEWLPKCKSDELVWLWDDTVLRGLRPLRTIGKIYLGRDGIVLIVNVPNKTSVYRRPVVKTYPLEEQTFDEVPQGGRM